jgi:hypothetical protein
MIKRFLFLFLIPVGTLTAAPVEPYIGINITAPFTSAGERNSSFRMYVPIFSNNEYGFAVNGGIIFKNHHMLEARISFGSPHGLDMSRLFQLHFGYRFLVLDYFELTSRGLYAGGNIRFSVIRYPHSGVSYFTIMPDICTGYHMILYNVFFDARLSFPFWALSWSSAENTKPGTAFLVSPAKNIAPVVPLASFDMGWAFTGR